MALKDNYFTITQAAREMGVTRQTISRWIEQGKLSAEKVGRETLIAKKEFNKPEFKSRKLRASIAGQFAKQFREQTLAAVKTGLGFDDETDLTIREARAIDKNKANLVLSIMKKDGTRQVFNAVVEIFPDKTKFSKKSEHKYEFEMPATIEIDDEVLKALK